jgi:Transglycosylase
MTKKTLARRLLLGAVAAPILLYLALECSYFAALSTVPGRPTRGHTVLPSHVSRALWSALEEGPTQMGRGHVWQCVLGRTWPGSDVAYAAAKEYLRRTAVVEQWRASGASAASLRWKLAVGGLMIWISRNMTGEEALGYWADDARFGDGVHGVTAAAKQYFGKSVPDLTVDEAATLAAVARSSRYRPDCFPREAKQVRDEIIGRMVQAGDLSAEVATELREKPIQVESSPEQCP